MEFSPETIISYQASFQVSLLLALIAMAVPLLSRWTACFRLQYVFSRRYLLAMVAVFALGGSLSWHYFAKSLPGINGIANIGPVSSKILDKNGVLLYEIHGETKRTPVPLSQISDNVIKATVAIEDKEFYEHKGVSISSIARAAYENYKAKHVTQGGSTITQQLVKLNLLTSEKSYERKLKEAVLALKIEKVYSKDEILEMYLNRVPYGRNTYGIEAASLAYLAKHAKDLTLAEAAYLAALPKAPSLYSPTGATAAELDTRKNKVLASMLELGQINQTDYDTASQEKVAFSRGKTELAAPYFVKWVEGSLEQQYGRQFLEEEGLIIQTSLDSNLQAIAEKVVSEGAATNSRRYNANNAALVAIQPETGYILAMTGGKDYFATPEPAGCMPGKNCTFDPQTNVAVSNRQPGSSFKPYTYVTAFSPQFGYSPASKILDRSQNFSRSSIPYRPVNYSGKTYGLVSMRKALAGSLNIAAVRTLSQIGVPSVVETVKALGINTPMEKCGLSLTLGACEVKLVEHVAAYSVLANMGDKANVTPIIKITDKRGRLLYEHQPDLIPAVNPQAAYQVVDIMTDNNARSYVFGSRSPLTLKDRKVAAKTGTSQDFKDGWTIGFTPQLAAGVWVGNNDGRLMRHGADGVVVAAPIWNKFMQEALKDVPAEDFAAPAGIQRVRISASSGRLATQFTPDAVYEVFADYSAPKLRDTYRPPVEVLLPDIGGSSEPIPDNANLPAWAREGKEITSRRRTAP
jgi:1A family penicillin-binding protein